MFGVVSRKANQEAYKEAKSKAHVSVVVSFLIIWVICAILTGVSAKQCLSEVGEEYGDGTTNGYTLGLLSLCINFVACIIIVSRSSNIFMDLKKKTGEKVDATLDKIGSKPIFKYGLPFFPKNYKGSIHRGAWDGVNDAFDGFIILFVGSLVASVVVVFRTCSK
jgi:uncharacterized membrane protein (DUF485 family)